MSDLAGVPDGAAGTVAVVGGGIAGLSVAWELARAGVQVELYEAGDQVGGALAPLQLDGVRVDAEPKPSPPGPLRRPS